MCSMIKRIPGGRATETFLKFCKAMAVPTLLNGLERWILIKQESWTETAEITFLRTAASYKRTDHIVDKN